jgi:hypothetical protein
MLKSYHDQTMAQGVRVQVVLPPAVAADLKAQARDQGRTVSSLSAFLLEAALSDKKTRTEALAGE